MGIIGAEPEAEGFFLILFLPCRQKGIRVLEALAGGVALPVGGIARSPGLAPTTREVAPVLEKVGISLMFGVENTPEIAATAQSLMVLAGQNGMTGGRAGRRGNIGVMKEDAVSGNGVESGCLTDIVILVDAGVGPTPVVGDREDDIGPFGRG